MRRCEVISILEEHSEEYERFGVKSLRLFGSVARDEAKAGSDVDVLVDFYGPPTFLGYMRFRFFLEDLLGTKVDLITESGLRDRVRPYVEKDVVRVA